jgi:hypothetical protein
LNYNSTNLLTTTQPISTTWIASSFAVASDSMIASALEAFATTTVLVTKVSFSRHWAGASSSLLIITENSGINTTNFDFKSRFRWTAAHVDIALSVI